MITRMLTNVFWSMIEISIKVNTINGVCSTHCSLVPLFIARMLFKMSAGNGLKTVRHIAILVLNSILKDRRQWNCIMPLTQLHMYMPFLHAIFLQKKSFGLDHNVLYTWNLLSRTWSMKGCKFYSINMIRHNMKWNHLRKKTGVEMYDYICTCFCYASLP